MRQKKVSQIFLSLGLCLLLAACTSAPEMPEICPPSGPCTLAPKKATSRPYQIKGVWYYPQPHYEYDEVGIASYYGGGDVFHGRPTATGKIFDMNGITAAHKTVPLPCIAEVTNLENGRQITVEVNDRGPFIEGRIIDLSRRVAQLLGFEGKGTAKVRVRTLVPETLVLNNIDPSTVMLAAAPPLPAVPPLPAAPPLAVASSFSAIIDDLEKFTVTATSLPSPLQSPPPLTRGIFVDVGGYETQEEAKTMSKRLASLADSPIQSIQNKGTKPYAVRVGPLASMSTANQVLDQLAEAGHRTSRIIILR
ncbi:MAG: septal ring lytic transglycosylase RlpA family protein [Proteobacteria bacterium]|nr:septal ring lytic transglycosylase RlpA family protein [Pseudomonadota bacterium]